MSVNPRDDRPVTVATLVNYLLGRASAIRRIATCPNVVWLGFVFVLSAGLAREYDADGLFEMPWLLLLPLGASLVTSFLLFALLWVISVPGKGADFLRGYRSFLGLYWLTAPLAWLYAIPVERHLTEASAMRANLLLLAVVAVWRVVLMVRVVSVLFEARHRAALFPVMLFADTVALVLLFNTPLPGPIIAVMGGIRLTESEQVLRSVMLTVGFWGILSWPVWAIGTPLVAGGFRYGNPAGAAVEPATAVARSLWMVAVLSVLVWVPVIAVMRF